MALSESRKALQKLIDRYNQYKDDKSFLSNEKQACISLIVPLIHEVLNWETQDPASFKAEESQGGKRIDYVVYHDGRSKFIVEAKAPIKDIFGNKEAYDQAIRYAQGKQHDFALLTNFRQVVILAPSVQFEVSTAAEIARIDLLSCSDDDLQKLLFFEREYWISQGSNNALYNLLSKRPRATPIGERLVQDMKSWREIILTNLKKHSTKNRFDFIDEENLARLEEEVQNFIDRLVFICFCEDRELEEPELLTLLQNKLENHSMNPGYLLKKIIDLFERYRRYNSDLWDKSECDKFYLDDDKLIGILQDLRAPKGVLPPDFRSIEADILGHAYENFLGHLTTGTKRFKEKEDKGKRKEEGIYYTPKYIVDYIIDNSLRERIKGLTFDEIMKIKVLDPACGSGSFLIRAFEILVIECEQRLKRNLNYEEKKSVALNCIFGVDLDSKAVSIARFNLMLRLAERHNPLPQLKENIKIGNSIIDDKNIAGYNAFVWEEEFKEIMEMGGFDVVIGNPPWGADVSDKERDFYSKRFVSNKRESETHLLFLEQSIRLIADKGVVGYITPNTWMYLLSAEPLREKLLDNSCVVSLLELTKHIFQDAPDIVPVIVIVQKCNNLNVRKMNWINTYSFSDLARINESDINKCIYKKIKQSDVRSTEGSVFNLSLVPDVALLLKKIDSGCSPLNGMAKTNYGIKTGNNEKFLAKSCKNLSYKKCLKSREVSRYSIRWNGLWLHYTPNLAGYRKDKVDVPKIIIQYIRKLSLKRRLICGFDDTGEYYPLNNYSYITANKEVLLVLLAILNSKLINFYFSNTFIDYNIKPTYIGKIPIRKDETHFSKLAPLALEMLSLSSQLSHLNKGSSDSRICKEIESVDAKIDNEVYKLYSLSPPEIRIIEDSLKSVDQQEDTCED